MNLKKKLGYMFIGCLFTIAGYILASLVGATQAQQNGQVIDKIVCKQLEVVNKEGKTIVHIYENNSSNGAIQLYNTKGEGIVSIASIEFGGSVTVNTAEKSGEGNVTMSSFIGSPRLYVTNKLGERVVEVSTSGEDGIVSVKDRNGEKVAELPGK